MNLHEYQAKKLFRDYGLPVPPGEPAFSVREALRHAAALGGSAWIVKAQVHAGGRGKAGGVKKANNVQELEACVHAMLDSRLVTHQSGPRGQPVHCVLVQGLEEILRELYLGMLVDRGSGRVAIVASPEGGMNIEEIAVHSPERIRTFTIHPALGLLPYQARQVGFFLELNGPQRKQLGGVLAGLYRLFLDKDLSLVEINPLIVDGQGALQLLDAKVSLDGNALFRQGALAEWRDPSQEEEREREAQRHDLNYVALDGDIACMVNGAGLAMATMDVIQLHGGRPANFLDVGGGTTVGRVSEAFKLIAGDTQVRAILINIFGGIVRCDLIAEGIVQAVREVGVRVPIVARLEGTNVNEGRRLLKDSGLSIVAAQSLADAAAKAVRAAQGK